MSTTPHLHAPRELLPSPTVDYAERGALDPDKVPASGTRIRVLTTANTQVGDILHVYWTGPENDENDSLTDYMPINAQNAGREIPFPVAKRLVSANEGQQITVGYEIERERQRLPSEVLRLTIGGAQGQYPRPKVVQAPADTLDPMTARNGVEVVVTYPTMSTSQNITLHWQGTPGAGTPDPQSERGSASGSQSFDIPAAVVGANVGKSVTLYYRVTSQNAEPIASERTILTVSPFAATDLPSPDAEESRNATLDLSTFASDAHLTTVPWPLIAIGQRFWMQAEGENSDGSRYSKAVATAQLVTSSHLNDGLRLPLARRDLEGLRNNSTLTLSLRVTFDGANDAASAQPFTPTNLRVVVQPAAALPAPVIIQAVGGKLDPLNALGSAIARIRYPDMLPSDTLVLYYRNDSGTYVPVDGYVSGSVTQTQYMNVPHAIVALHIGRSLVMQYRLTRADVNLPDASSEELKLDIQPFSPELLRAPMPEQAVNGVLDLKRFATDAALVLEDWFWMAAGQRLWLTVSGTLASGRPFSRKLAEAQLITAQQAGLALVYTLERSDLASLESGSELHFETSVNFEGNDRKSRALAFPASKVTIRL